MRRQDPHVAFHAVLEFLGTLLAKCLEQLASRLGDGDFVRAQREGQRTGEGVHLRGAAVPGALRGVVLDESSVRAEVVEVLRFLAASALHAAIPPDRRGRRLRQRMPFLAAVRAPETLLVVKLARLIDELPDRAAGLRLLGILQRAGVVWRSLRTHAMHAGKEANHPSEDAYRSAPPTGTFAK